MSNKFVGEDDGVVAVAKLPVCLCLDTSGSMYDCIGELTEGVGEFFKAISGDEMARLCCEISVTTFDSNVNVVQEFAMVDQCRVPELRAYGGTEMFAGIARALSMLDSKKEEYKNAGVDYYQPWLVVMSDGAPNSIDQSIIDDLQKRQEDKKLTVFCLGIGSGADMELMRRLTKKVMKLKEHSFSAFFEWLGKSVSTVSKSQVGEKVVLPKPEEDFFEI